MADWGRLPADVEVRVFNDNLKDPLQIVSRLKSFEILVVNQGRTPFPASLLKQLPNLVLIVTPAPGNPAIDMRAAREYGISVCGCDTASVGYATAELTWGLLLALARKIPVEDQATRLGNWQTTLGTGLQGKTLGLLGLGRLGSQIAAYGRAFQMTVQAWSENLTQERAAQQGVVRVDKGALFEQADFLSIHLQQSARTIGLIGPDELALMKPSAYLINTSRGPIVDEQALIQALQRGVIAGAALDVFDDEPLPLKHPLRNLPNTIITPHIGYVTQEMYRLVFNHTIENIMAFLDGNPIRLLNP